MCSDPIFPDPIFPVVLDTNIVLDAFVFNDPAARPLQQALATDQLRWIATKAMRDELARVLTYPKIGPWLARDQRGAAHVLAQFDGQARLVDSADKASVVCQDPDDQKFIDLAVAHQALLLSKDQAVLGMRKKLLAFAVRAQEAL